MRPPSSSHDATDVGHAPCADTHEHEGTATQSGGIEAHEYESGGTPPSASAMPGA